MTGGGAATGAGVDPRPAGVARRSAARPAVWIVATACLVVVAHACLILGRPLLTTDMAQDVLIFIDAAHRVQSGLHPHLDFVTGLGALNFYGPGLWGLVDDPFRSFALFHILALTAVLSLALYVALTRALDGFAGTLLILYLGATVGAPSNLGDPAGALSFAMWYNRVAWGLLLVGAILLLEPRRRGSRAVEIGDGLTILVIGLVSFYLKITYAAAAAGLIAFAFLVRPHLRRPAVGAAIATLGTLAGIELATGGLNSSYVRDLIEIAAVNGGALLDPTRLLPSYRAILYEFGLAAAAIVIVGLTRRDATRVDLAFVLILAALSNYLHSTSVQTSGLVALFAVPLMAYLRAANGTRDGHRTEGASPPRVVLLLAAIAVAFAAPELVNRYASLALYATSSARDGYPFAAPPRLADGMIVTDVDPRGTHRFLARLVAGEPPQAVLTERAAYKGLDVDPHAASQAEYAYLMAQGALAIQELARRDGGGPGPVVVLDFANPISAILDLPPARGDYAWFHLGRNIDEEHVPSPDRLLANARYVMAPKFSTNPDTVAFLLRAFGAFLADRYRLVDDGPLWRIWAKRAEEGPG